MTVRQNDDTVYVPGDLFHAVAYQHNGRAARAVILANVCKQLFPALRIKPGAWLVQHQHLRLHGNHARDSHAALLPARKGEGRLFQQVLRKARKARRVMHAAVDLFFGKAHVARSESDITVNGLFKKLVLRVLEHQPHAEAHTPDLFGIRPDILAAEINMPRRRLQKAVQVLDQR